MTHRLTVLALILAVLVPIPDAHAADPESGITLVTGDRVSVRPGGYHVATGPGRSHIRFVEWRRQDRTLVIPSDAIKPLVGGRLDERLFDVSYLNRNGYRDSLPLIVGGRSTTVAEDNLSGFWRGLPEASKVWLDGKVRATLDLSARQIGAPQAWSAGLTGKGVTVAVLDSGIDTTHPDLAGVVIRSQDFSGSGHTGDGTGHGTHVASTIAGSGKRFRGIAPGARILNAKVLDDSGSGDESAVISAMEWAVAQGAQVVNLSLGKLDEPGVDPMEETVNRLSARYGTLFVAGAGNEGPDGETVYSPSTADAAVSVGSVDKSDFVADHSSRGPRPGDLAPKPDITAPGVAIVAARAGGGYVGMSGTSMATPHVSGAAAILLQRRPGWSAEQLKPVLTGTAAAEAGHTVDEQGAGRVDVRRALSQQVYAAPHSLSLGDAKQRTVTYHNRSSRTVTLNPRVKGPRGMLTVTPRRLTIHPGSHATATVRLDARVGPAGRFSAELTADGIRVPIGLTTTSRTYAYTIRTTDRQNDPAPAFGTVLNTETHTETRFAVDESGTTTLQLPKGPYVVIGTVIAPGDEWVMFADPALRLDQDRVSTFDGRLGQAAAMTVPRDDARVVLSHVSLSYRDGPIRSEATGRVPLGLSFGAASAGADRLSRLYVIPSRRGPREFSTSLFALWARPRESDVHPIQMFRQSPYAFHLARVHRGGVPASLSWTVRQRELAEVRTDYASVMDGRNGHKLSNFSVDGSPLEAQFPWPLASTLPFTRTEYYAPGVAWDHTFIQERDSGVQDLEAGIGRVSYQPRKYHERWNSGVFAPAFGKPPILAGEYAVRRRNTMKIRVPSFSDGTPGHSGFGLLDTRLTLRRGSEELAESGTNNGIEVAVTPDPSTYRLTVDTSPHEGVSRLSAKVSTTWTFRSAHVPGTAWQPLPLMAVRYTPSLDEHNRAPGGRQFRLPITVEHQRKVRFTVAVSYDDGTSWHRVPVTAGTALLDHPPTGFVSLRTHAVDARQNTVTQTVIRAYQLR